MKQAAFARLARIEAHSAKALAGQHGGSEYKLKTALLAIVATHIGKLGGNDSCAEGIARALGVTPPELARALSNDRDGLIRLCALSTGVVSGREKSSKRGRPLYDLHSNKSAGGAFPLASALAECRWPREPENFRPRQSWF
jgi:hypothetical protein